MELKLIRKIEDAFFEHASGEWNDWRIRRNWDVLKKQIKEKLNKCQMKPTKK